MGMMVEVLKQTGTWHVSSEVLKMPVNTVYVLLLDGKGCRCGGEWL